MFNKIYKIDCCEVCKEYLNLENMRCDFTCCHRIFNKQTGILREIENRQIFERGYLKGIEDTKSDIRYTRFMSLSDQEKFLKRFNECIKPIEELKKDLENGKF